MVDQTDHGADAPLPDEGAPGAGVDRRSALRKIGAGAGLAWAAPTVIAVGAPSPAAAQSVSCGCSVTYSFGRQSDAGTRQVVFTLSTDCTGLAQATVYAGPDPGALSPFLTSQEVPLPVPPVSVDIPCGQTGRVDVVIIDPDTRAVLCTSSTGFGVVSCEEPEQN